MLAQALEANGAIVYILGRRQEVLEKAASTAVRIAGVDLNHDSDICPRNKATSGPSKRT
jgi:NADP-dependent 3-hydroxy acid dehydrogenase YdfG